MKTIELNLYKFDELSDEAKQTAIEKERNSEYGVYLDFFQDDAKEQIDQAGFYDDVKLQYSLSYCQGDGLSFSCKRIKESVLLSFFAEVLGAGKEKTANIIMQDCEFICKSNNHRYCYASKSDIDYTLENYNRIHDNCELVIEKVREKIENLYMDLCKDLERQGYKEIEWQQGDECISENLSSNDYDFTIDGLIY